MLSDEMMSTDNQSKLVHHYKSKLVQHNKSKLVQHNKSKLVQPHNYKLRHSSRGHPNTTNNSISPVVGVIPMILRLLPELQTFFGDFDFLPCLVGDVRIFRCVLDEVVWQWAVPP